MKYIDVHAHLNLEEFKNDINEIAKKTREDDVMVINVGTGQASSETAVQLAKKYDHMKAIVGLHPIYASPSYVPENPEVFSAHFYRNLVLNNREHVLAIGECGLDYFHGNETSKQLQEKAFREQIELAIEMDLPLMLHIRPSLNTYDAYHDVLAILGEYKKRAKNLRGDVHFFAGTTDIAQAFLDMGFYISFTGVITFAKMYEELVRFVSLEKILSETDAPYVAPAPFRGQRNESSHVREVVKKIAEIKNLDEELVARQLMQNAKTLFRF